MSVGRCTDGGSQLETGAHQCFSHLSHTDEPASEVSGSVHEVHSSLGDSFATLPASHSAHATAPPTVDARPAGHASHVVALMPDA